MNENITYHILNYINSSTNYAVVISGNYGIGKTHFIQNSLFPKIQEIKIGDARNEKQKFKTITISLFGIKTIEDIEKLIFLELFAPAEWKKKGLKIIGAVFKGAGSFFNVDIDKVLKESSLSAGELNKYNDLVICIDDIDRKSKELDLIEIYGFINNLVENLGTKVILVANEDTLRDEINSKSSDAYSVLREKVIGISFPFQTDVRNIFFQLIENYKTESNSYFELLKQQSDYIIECVEKNNKNIRNLLFFLEQFRIVFIELSKELDKQQNDLINKKNEILERVLKSFLPISFEYKLGKLSDTNQKELTNYLNGNNFDWGLANLAPLEDNNQSYLDTFKAKYNFNRNELIFFESIFNYIVGKERFNADKTISELTAIYNINDENYDEKDELYKKLQYWEFVNLTYSEYRVLTNQLIAFAKEGKLQIDEYTDAFLYAIRFNNLLNYNIDKLKRDFLVALEKHKSNFDFKKSSFLYRNSIDRSSPHYDSFIEILQKCIEVNESNNKRIEKEQLTGLFNEFKNKPSEFILSCSDNALFIEKPFFAEFSFIAFWSIIKSLKNTDIIEFSYVIEHRYDNYYPGIEVEKDFLQELKLKITEKVNSKSISKMNKIPYNFLLEKIEISITNISNR